MGTLIRRCDEPTCEVEGKVPLRRDVIERGGSSEAWYGGRARRSVGQHTVSSMPPSLPTPRGDTHCTFIAMGPTRRDSTISRRTVMNNVS